MIQLKTPIPDHLADELEAYFCEDGSDHWMIESIPGGRDFHLYGFYPTTEEAQSAYHQLRDVFSELPLESTVSELPDQDWQNAYKFHFQPWQCGQLHWVPIWMQDEYTVPEHHKALYLDPGMAFGTGNHETTRLCVEGLLEYFEQQDPRSIAQKTIIDAGCGSGILSLSAALLGFQNIQAFDIDQDSIRICHENTELNNLKGSVTFSVADLATGIPEHSSGLILANILAPILSTNSEILLNGLRPESSSTLILSGILQKEVDSVHKTFLETAQSLSLNITIERRDLGIWSALICKI